MHETLNRKTIGEPLTSVYALQALKCTNLLELRIRRL